MLMKVIKEECKYKKKKRLLISLMLLGGGCLLVWYINRDGRNGYVFPDVQNEISYQMDTWDWKTDAPAYSFFSNANEWHYNLTNEMDPAGIILHYTKENGLKEEKWELRKMYTRWSESGEYVSTAFVRSESGRELYLYIEELGNFFVVADIMKGNSLSVPLGNNDYTYDSSVLWCSYKERLQKRGEHLGYSILADEGAYIYDEIYIEEGALALAEFLSTYKVDRKAKWELVKDKIYIGVNGYLADLWYKKRKKRVHMVIDIWNKLYAVIEVFDER